jgi:hypothetical protein
LIADDFYLNSRSLCCCRILVNNQTSVIKILGTYWYVRIVPWLDDADVTVGAELSI